MPLPDHLFLSSDGSLYDTRDPDWSRKPAVRPRYAATPRDIVSPQDVSRALRSGPYAWPGGYALYVITADGDVLSFDAVRAELRQVMEAVARQDKRSGWCATAVASAAETDAEVICAHTGAVIAQGAEEDA